MDISVTDRASIERGWSPGALSALISINNPGIGPVHIPPSSPFRDVLHLAFHDVEPLAGVALPWELKAMTLDQARQIWRFARGHQKYVHGFVVHCQSGMSRSPAVAAALAIYFGGDEKRFWINYTPNRHVYRLLLETIPEHQK